MGKIDGAGGGVDRGGIYVADAETGFGVTNVEQWQEGFGFLGNLNKK